MDYLVGHFVGDILFQNRRLAHEKARSLYWLLIHCLIVTLCVGLFAWRWDLSLALVFLSHLAIDGLGIGKDWWPRLMRQGVEGSDEIPAALKMCDDQIIHLVALWLIYSL